MSSLPFNYFSNCFYVFRLKCRYVGSFPLRGLYLNLKRFLFGENLPSRQTYPLKPGRHPWSHKPVTSLQSLHVSTHFIAQFSPKKPCWQAEEEMKNNLIEYTRIIIIRSVNTYMFNNFKQVSLTCFTQMPLKTSNTPGYACSVSMITLEYITTMPTYFIAVISKRSFATFYESILSLMNSVFIHKI